VLALRLILTLQYTSWGRGSCKGKRQQL
jgi:hypothetical protein